MVDILSSFGLSAASGLNAYLPLLIVGLLSRYTNLIQLSEPWNLLENGWVLLVLAVLLAVEMTADKIPAVDTANDAIQTVVRPTAGALLFAASNNVVTDISPVLALVLGLLMAGSVHAAKATVRPVVTATTGGIGNPVVSTVEDIVSGGLTLVSLLMPILAAILMLVVILLLARLFWRTLRRRQPLPS
jgi:hypothetical protein